MADTNVKFIRKGGKVIPIKGGKGKGGKKRKKKSKGPKTFAGTGAAAGAGGIQVAPANP